MHLQEEKWAIFWCDLLKPIIFEEIEEEGIHQFLQKTAQTPVVFPDGRMATPSVSTLKRKLYRCYISWDKHPILFTNIKQKATKAWSHLCSRLSVTA
jgi:hypothetical protein